jgi:ubiquinone/menaquinone biosynthesis C-methylase UbiE
MNYDKTDIPRVYDAGRAYSPEMLAIWVDLASKEIENGEVRSILDVGCGTGRFSSALAAHFNADVIAIDPSERMLAAARRKPSGGVRYVGAAAEALPFPDGSTDMAFMSMVFHHFDDPDRAVQECRRVLRPGGVVCLRAATTDRILKYPYVRFFQRSAAVLGDMLRSQAFIRSTFTKGGFKLVRHELVHNTPARSWAEYAERLATRAIAALAHLTEQEFEEGLDAVRRFAATACADPVVEPIDFFCFRLQPRPSRKAAGTIGLAAARRRPAPDGRATPARSVRVTASAARDWGRGRPRPGSNTGNAYDLGSLPGLTGQSISFQKDGPAAQPQVTDPHPILPESTTTK